jgi:DNA polymerase type B, organellar and viral
MRHKNVKRKPKLKKQENKIATFDYETDPFMYGRIPKPFVGGFYSELTGFKYFWHKGCAQELVDFLKNLKVPHTIYAHNGGKFDFFMMLEHLENPVRIINGRIVEAKLGIHTLRDSYAILPIPLRVFDKDDIDYQKLEEDVRDENRAEILRYLEKDCTSLFSLVSQFRARFGDKLTIGGTAIKKLQEMHPFESQKKFHDDKFRPYYFGGRVEAFETGILQGNWRVYDVNSMYPHVMRNCAHPTGSHWKRQFGGIVDKKGRISGISDAKVYFAQIHCTQRGCFPVRRKGESLDFNVPVGEFFVTSHELQAAIECGRVSNITVIECYAPSRVISFADYVDTFSAEKIAAKAAGDKAGEIFAKLLLNSAYGKFGQNPEHYFDYEITPENGDNPEGDDWELYHAANCGPSIWRKPSRSQAFYDVATAASITGAARALLLRALHSAERAVYCDTDSIICETLNSPLDHSELGKWKLEAEGNTVAIAGKKLYALRDGKKYVKIASKGAVLTGSEIFAICKGDTIQWHNQAPSFSLKKDTSFVSRKIKLRDAKKVVKI